MWWPVGDDIRAANQTMVPKQTWAIIYGLQHDTIYKLRVMGVNRGGDGKKSPTVYFTLLRGIILSFLKLLNALGTRLQFSSFGLFTKDNI